MFRHAIGRAAASLVFSASLVVAGLPRPLQAADDPAAIVVTATRFPQAVASLPAAVSVLTREDIARSPARTLPELLSTLAGVASRDFFGNNAGTATVDIRGYGVTGAQNTLILVDGQRLNDIDLTSVQWAAIPPSAIERVEVLRGAGAVAYGEGASAGVINIITRSPLTRRPNAEGRIGAGSFGSFEGQLSAGFAAETFGIRAHASAFQIDGYRTNSRNEQKNGSLRLRWAADVTTLDLRASFDRGDTRLPGARRIQPSTGLDELTLDRRAAQTPRDYASRDGLAGGLELSHRFGETELRLGADLRSKDQRSYFDQSGFPRSQADDLAMRAVTPRIRLPFVVGPIRNDLVLGLDWIGWRLDSRRTPRPEQFDRPVNRVRLQRDNEAVFVQDAMTWGDTRAMLGYRGERARYEAQDRLDTTAPGFTTQTQAPAMRQTQHQRAWEIGLQHAFTPRWAGFLRSSRSFRLANVDEIYETDAAFNAQFQLLRPQHALTNELGTTWRSNDDQARLTLFRSDVTDEIHLDPFTSGVGNTNLPLSRRQGLEAEAGTRLSRDFRLTAAYTYTDARFRHGILPGGAFAIGTNLVIAGRRVPLVSKHKLNLGLDWAMTPATRLTASLASQSAQFMDNDEPNTLGVAIPRRTLVDLKLSHAFGGVRAALAVNNLFNRKVHDYAVRSAFTADRYAVYPLPGTTLGLSLEAALP